MSKNKTTNTSRLNYWIDRIGNPLEWSTVNKSLLIIYLWTIIAIILIAVFAFLLRNPEIAPFMDRSFLRAAMPFGFGSLILWILLLAIGLRLRHHDPQNRTFAFIVVFLWWTQEAVAAISVGPLTTPQGLMILGQGFVCLLLFEKTIVITGLLWAVSLITLSTVVSQYGLFPYAPILSVSLHDGEKVAGFWAKSMGISYLLMYFAFLLLFYYIIFRWRNRENRLAEMSLLLKKMFGRYLSTDVMNSIIENPSALELGGERRRVTIMITDLRGFTALSEQLEPEQVVSMLNTYFDIIVDVVLKYHGTINEILGDALLVIFGAPQNIPDQAQRAIACAIEMQNSMVQVNEQNRIQGLPELEMGIGLNETEAIVGNIGSHRRSKYTVVGSGVNMASRIESYSVGGQILISESLYKKAGHILRIDGQREILPKGADSAFKIYEVGGIAGGYNISIEEKDPPLVTLPRQIPFNYKIIEGKKVGQEKVQANLMRISRKAAEICTQATHHPLTNIKMNLDEVPEELASISFYGKIMDQNNIEENTYYIRFTAIPLEIKAYFQGFQKHTADA